VTANNAQQNETLENNSPLQDIAREILADNNGNIY